VNAKSRRSTTQSLCYNVCVANLTLNVPDALLEQAKQLANKRGLSLNALVRELLERTVGPPADEWWENHKVLLGQVGKTEKWVWNREELYERD
jgi:hypothetical protein